MNARPFNGGILLEGDTTHVAYAITIHRDYDGPVFDADGNQLGEAVVKIAPPPPDQLALAKTRHDICAKCPAHADLTETTVTCRRRAQCRSHYNLLLPGLKCPEKRWPEP